MWVVCLHYLLFDLLFMDVPKSLWGQWENSKAALDEYMTWKLIKLFVNSLDETGANQRKSVAMCCTKAKKGSIEYKVLEAVLCKSYHKKELQSINYDNIPNFTMMPDTLWDGVTKCNLIIIKNLST